MTIPPDRAAHAYVGAFVDELVRAGLRHVCVAPGSRSAPLALTIARHAGLRTWMHLDERVAAFFALGMARSLDAPVALLCTSGTAAANFLPAVVEAQRAGVPLLVLTADRPPELRDVEAAQTIDQNRLYGAHAKWFVEVALPEANAEMLRYARTLACRSLATAAASPPGPVHLNFPFREPLVPLPGEMPADLSETDALAWTGRPSGEPWVRVAENELTSDVATVARLAERVYAARRPLIVCGPQFDSTLADPLAKLASMIGAPLLADPLSQLRWGAHDRSSVIDCYDAALRHKPLAASLVPDVVLRFGGVPTSKVLLQYLERHAASHQVVIHGARWPDPTLLAAEMVHADPRWLCDALLDTLVVVAAEQHTTVPSPADGGTHSCADAEWMRTWRRVNDVTGRALSAHSAPVDEPFEGRALAEVAEVVPAGGTLFVSSSMPVRDLDAFGRGDDRPVRVLANRGANGIDGVISTALGVVAAQGRDAPRLVLVIGDIAFYHDMNALLASKQYQLDATIVVINNDGGGIFSFLPQADHPEHFELLFGTPHGLRFAAAAELYGATYRAVSAAASLREAVAAGVEQGGLHIVELVTRRDRNVRLHRDAWAAVRSALADAGM